MNAVGHSAALPSASFLGNHSIIPHLQDLLLDQHLMHLFLNILFFLIIECYGHILFDEHFGLFTWALVCAIKCLFTF